MFVNGVPQPHAVLHDNLIYPGSIGNWEMVPVEHNNGRKVELVRISVRGDFGGCNMMLARLHQGASNRWEKTCHEDWNSGDLIHTFTFVLSYVTGHSFLYSKMYMYKAAVEIEKLLLCRLLNQALSRFTIMVNLNERGFTNFVSQAQDSTEQLTQNWLNSDTMNRVRRWFVDVIPTFVNCWIDTNALQAMQVFNTSTLEETSALDVLESRNDTVIVVASSRPLLINKGKLLRSLQMNSSAIRYACKERTHFLHIQPQQYLRFTALVDLQDAGMLYQALVRRELFHDIENNRSRVFLIFPSFDEFTGLLSQQVISSGDFNSGLHCQNDPPDQETPTVYRTHSIVQCPGDDGIRTAGNSCFSEADVFRTRKPSGCQDGYTVTPGDPTCCVFRDDNSVANMKLLMAIYGNRTTNNNRLEGVVEDAYEWFSEKHGKTDKIYVGEEYSVTQDIVELFQTFRPNCFELTVVVWESEGMPMNKAKELVTYATSNDLVYNCKWKIAERVTPQDCIELFNIRPKNKTVLEFTNWNNAPSDSAVLQVVGWFFSAENRQIGLKYFQVGGGRTAILVNMLKTQGYMSIVHSQIVERDHERLQKGHVTIFIDTVLFGHNPYNYHTVTLSFFAGPRYTPPPSLQDQA